MILLTYLKNPYPFKVWLFTLFAGPLVGIWYDFFLWPQDAELGWLFGGPILLTIGGVFISLPAFIIFFAVFLLFEKTGLPEIVFKLLLSLLAVAGVIGTLHFFLTFSVLWSQRFFSKLEEIKKILNEAERINKP